MAWAPRKAYRACPLTAGRRRSEPRAHQPLSARVLGRPASACWHRPRVRSEAKLIICDEPVSALDVSIQAQVHWTFLRSSRTSSVPRICLSPTTCPSCSISPIALPLCIWVKMVEVSDWKTLYSEPHHPYTQSLLSAVPVPDPDIQKTRKRIILAGDPPSPLDPPTGCRFHTRCPIAQGICSEKLPEFKEVAPGHCCACHFAEPFPIEESHIDL